MNNETQGPGAQPLSDTGLACLVMPGRRHHLAVSAEQLVHQVLEGDRVFTTPQLLLASKQIGLKAKVVSSHVDRLSQLPLPVIAVDAEGRFFIIARLSEDELLIHDPVLSSPRAFPSTCRHAGAAELILLRSDAALTVELSKFDFTLFIPAIVKYRKLLGEVLLVSFGLQIFALLTPLFFQGVMNKVLVHRGLSSLDVIPFGLLCILLFESALSCLRTSLFSHTASRLDVELGSRLFQHLVTLPLVCFQPSRVGESVARVRELEQIRTYLTGNSITLIFDVFFSVAIIAVMFVYGGRLTLVVRLALPLYFFLSLLMVTPPLRVRLNESFSRGGENQSFLVETINGIDTLKSIAEEPQIIRKWDNQLAGYVAAGFRMQNLSAFANQAMGLVGKLVTSPRYGWARGL
ncbi:ABC transporter transmembrane domain-containing protein [Pseudomonas huanghezhanensis]|uniref:ABC transporter transmembrane domain-containing protein n=1 Tax=Pseudomonas huanghezhanensis TaxID=3002903 RepID=UPI0038B6690D